MHSLRLKRIRWATCLFLFVQILFTWPLWFGKNVFPRVSLLPIDSSFLSVDVTLFTALVVSILLIAIRPRTSVFILFFTIGTTAILLDLNRWQPYFHYFGLVLFIVGLSTLKRIKPEQAVAGLVLLIAGVYLWSGVQKLNPWYSMGLEDAIYSGFGESTRVSQILSATVSLIPYFEILLALIILFPMTRRFGLWGSIIFHLGTLLFIGPPGLGINMVVWPWNLGMIGINWMLLHRNKTQAISLRSLSIPVMFAVCATWLFPITSCVSSHFAYQSFSLYSGRVPYATIIADENAFRCLPEDIRETAFRTDRGHEIYLQLASSHETGILVNPEPYVYKNWMDTYCDCKTSRYSLVLELQMYTFTERKLEYYYCD